jgi:MATE family, multidrug efflux pump
MRRIDLTQGPVLGNLVRLSVPIAVSMIVFTLYLLADLYFVAKLGPDAVAAISISINAFFVYLGIATILGSGAMVMIAQAAGRGRPEEAGEVFRQTLIMGLWAGIALSSVGVALAEPYMRFFGASGRALRWGVDYFQLFSASFVFLLLIYVIGSALRGIGDTRTPMVILFQSNLLNIGLDPVLIFGWLGLPAMGVRGAALASLLSQAYALLIYAYLILIRRRAFHIRKSWRLESAVVRRSLTIGLPSGLNHFFLAVNLLITYRVISSFGTAALAALGIGLRLLQGIYLPVIALVSAAAACIGQNYGAGNYPRVARTLRSTWVLSSAFMVLVTLVCRLFPAELISIFSRDPEVIRYGATYISVISIGNVVMGTIMTVAAVFQGLGKTYPKLVGAAVDNAVFAALVLTLPGIYGWGIQAVWWLKLVSLAAELLLICLWLRREMQFIRGSMPSATEPARAPVA